MGIFYFIFFFSVCLVDNGLQVMVEKKGEMFVGYYNKWNMGQPAHLFHLYY